MVRISGLDVFGGHDKSYNSTEPDERQNSLAGIQLPSFNPLHICGEEGDAHSFRWAPVLWGCETHQTVSDHLRIAQRQAVAVRQRDT